MNSTYTILYVDDDTDDLLLISEAFEKYTADLRVLHAHNGLEAMQVLKRMHNKGVHPCLVILDINMPIMDGKETLKEMRATQGYELIPVVMFSTSRSDTDKSFARRYNASFISKPHHYQEMEELVKQFVDQCHLEVRNTA